MRKGKDPGPFICLMDPDTNPGGPKKCGSGSPTLRTTTKYCMNRGRSMSIKCVKPIWGSKIISVEYRYHRAEPDPYGASLT
jgi:hypothetical protein